MHNDLEPPTKRSRDSAFALVLALSLMAFIVLLLLSLVTFIRVETGASETGKYQAMARQNALFGLNVALGELQRLSGPDARVTARADVLSNTSADKRNWTGVWDTTKSTDNGFIGWLVSSSSGAQSVVTDVANDFSSYSINSNLVQLLGPGSVNFPTSDDPGRNGVKVEKSIIASSAVSIGMTGRFAYWVGDQGVKAPVIVADKTEDMIYAPYDFDELRNRLKQQAGVQPTPVGFDPRDNANKNVLDKILSLDQIKLLTESAGEALLADQAPKNFHTWSPGNYSVLASTRSDGLSALLSDLSLNPDMLGDAFKAYMNFMPFKIEEELIVDGYMENPLASNPQSALPPINDADSMRRRYKITPPIVAANLTFSVAPVLSEFFLQFGIRAVNNTLELKVRFLVELWNPYTSALVPEDLMLEVTGLQPVFLEFLDSQRENVGSSTLDLQDAVTDKNRPAGGPMVIDLEFLTGEDEPDKRSWLPGRVYNWNQQTLTGVTKFYSRDTLNNNGWDYSPTILPAAPVVFSDVQIESINSAELTIKLYTKSNNQLLATYTSPLFDGFQITDPTPPGTYGYFRFGYHMQMNDFNEWLELKDRDPRNPDYQFTDEDAPNGLSPPVYSSPGYSLSQYASSLLDRQAPNAPRSSSYNEDVPVFELPRQPHLSVGALQHLQVTGQRPLSVGNAWSSATWNWMFDQCFFSGLPRPEMINPNTNAAYTGPNPSNGDPLPNFHLKTIDPTLTLDDLQNAGEFSAKYFLATGSFNLNSSSPEAWSAMLNSIRYPNLSPWFYVNKNDPEVNAALPDSKGTELESNPVLTRSFPDSAFFRFSQSAQETFKAEAGLSTGTETEASPPNTHLYRRGARGLTASQIDTLATEITNRIKVRFQSSGPFETVGKFLDSGLLEAAIAAAGINEEIEEFSSQWLTQADIMTALAPVLFNRSDTFLVRSYGEALNPANGESVGEAWCEALVQRMPQPIEPADKQSISDNEYQQPPGEFGRKFQIISFRWLDTLDI